MGGGGRRDRGERWGDGGRDRGVGGGVMEGGTEGW